MPALTQAAALKALDPAKVTASPELVEYIGEYWRAAAT
jgi:hypothetical protein